MVCISGIWLKNFAIDSKAKSPRHTIPISEVEQENDELI